MLGSSLTNAGSKSEIPITLYNHILYEFSSGFEVAMVS